MLADNNDTSVPEKMFSLCHAWAKENQAAFRGMVYIASSIPLMATGENPRFL